MPPKDTPRDRVGASSASFGRISDCAAMPRSKAQSLPVKEISSKLSKMSCYEDYRWVCGMSVDDTSTQQE